MASTAGAAWRAPINASIRIATVFANAVFASITGISVASASVFSRIAVPEMTRHGYTRKFSTGVVAGSSVLGMLIPPSLLMVVYAVLAEESVGRMFLSGVGPGILLSILFAFTILLLAWWNPGFVYVEERRGAVGANCIVGPQRMLDLVRMIAEECALPILAMPTPGFPQLVKGQVAYDTSPDYFAKATMRLAEEGARVLGGCCGTTPDHIRELKKALGKGVKVRARTRRTTVEREAKALPETQPTELMMKLGRKFINAVELDVPRGVNLDALLRVTRHPALS